MRRIEKKAAETDLKMFLRDVSLEKAVVPGNGNLPKISIVTPSFNQGQFLRDNILSVVNQGYPDSEHLVIDGGSTDSTVDVLRSFEDRIDYWVSEPDRGQSHALNKGLEVATGEIIGWQNSDDFYLPGAFREAGSIFRDYPAVDVLYGDYLYVDEEGHVKGSKKYAPLFSIGEYIYVGANISNQSVFFRKSVLERAGGFEENLHLAMDFDLFLRLAAFARFRHVRAYLGGYRIHGTQKGQQLLTDTDREYMDIRERLGLRVTRDIPWKRQYQLRKFYYRTRRNFLKLFYYPRYLNDPLYRAIRD